MNEELKNLLVKAGFILWEDESWKPQDAIVDWSSNYDKEIACFAELLKEALFDKIKQLRVEDKHPLFDLNHDTGYNSAITDALFEILNFGKDNE